MPGSTKLPFGRIFNSVTQWCQNAAAALTGSTTATQLARILIPGGYLGPNGELDIVAASSNTNSANNKTLTVTIGNVGVAPATVLTQVNTTTTFASTGINLTNRNAANSQLVTVTDLAGVVTKVADPAINTELDIEIIVKGTLALGSETMTLEKLAVKSLYRD